MSGWPDPDKPGVPANPARDDFHWIVGWSDKLFVAEWDSDQQDYVWFDGGDDPSGMVENGWTYAGPVLTPDEAGTLRAENARLREALKNLLDRDERNTCQHEETHRGGFLWEICDVCGAKWADDMGGKTEWKDPPEWVAARDALEVKP
jgi:hypothetical protein